eukprot:6045847-Amphidinium_carterae.1
MVPDQKGVLIKNVFVFCSALLERAHIYNRSCSTPATTPCLSSSAQRATTFRGRTTTQPTCPKGHAVADSKFWVAAISGCNPAGREYGPTPLEMFHVHLRLLQLSQQGSNYGILELLIMPFNVLRSGIFSLLRFRVVARFSLATKRRPGALSLLRFLAIARCSPSIVRTCSPFAPFARQFCGTADANVALIGPIAANVLAPQ